MQLAGTSSWRLTANDRQLCEFGLFVRDAVGLAGSGADEVPALLGTVADLTDVLDAEARHEAAGQWRAWWARLVDAEFRGRADGDRHAVFDPPDFASLRDRRALHTAVRASFPELRTWAASMPTPTPATSAPLGWQLTRQVAEDVAFDRHVQPGDVQATVALVRVGGSWWRRVAPGAVLYCPGAAADPTTAHALLRDAFDSFVTRVK